MQTSKGNPHMRTTQCIKSREKYYSIVQTKSNKLVSSVINIRKRSKIDQNRTLCRKPFLAPYQSTTVPKPPTVLAHLAICHVQLEGSKKGNSTRNYACRVYGRYSRIAHDRVYPSKMEQFRIDKDHFSSVFKLAFEDLASTRSVMVVISICRRWEVKAKQKNKKYRIQSCSITRSVFRCCHKYFRACQTMSNSNHFDLPSECPLEQFHH